MSRIHEALKKAELERGSEAATETPSAPSYPHASGESPVETPAPPSSRSYRRRNEMGSRRLRRESSQQQKRCRPLPEEGVLQLNDILERCSHPLWNLDPNRSVFLDPELTADGAEQFRTLRSRLYQKRSDQSSQTLLSQAHFQERERRL